jgi:hypothetical protein
MATNSGPLAFSLDMICGGKVTVSEPVNRVTATNTTGQVTYSTVYLGCVCTQSAESTSLTLHRDHFAEAVMLRCVNPNLGFELDTNMTDYQRPKHPVHNVQHLSDRFCRYSNQWRLGYNSNYNSHRVPHLIRWRSTIRRRWLTSYTGDHEHNPRCNHTRTCPTHHLTLPPTVKTTPVRACSERIRNGGVQVPRSVHARYDILVHANSVRFVQCWK